MLRRSRFTRNVMVVYAIIAALYAISMPVRAMADTMYMCTSCSYITQPLPEPPNQCPNCYASQEYLVPIDPGVVGHLGLSRAQGAGSPEHAGYGLLTLQLHRGVSADALHCNLLAEAQPGQSPSPAAGPGPAR